MPEKYEDTRKAVLDLTEKLDSFLIAFQGQTHDDSVQRHEMVVELRQIKAEVTQIKQIVVGVDGGNGLRLEVREIARRVGTVEKTWSEHWLRKRSETNSPWIGVGK